MRGEYIRRQANPQQGGMVNAPSQMDQLKILQILQNAGLTPDDIQNPAKQQEVFRVLQEAGLNLGLQQNEGAPAANEDDETPPLQQNFDDVE